MQKQLGLFAVLLGASSADATVVLKGGNAAFRVKTVSAKTRIENGVAATTLVWTFADSRRNWKPEVEFFYGAPPRGVVTFFAYYFKGERVVARVVEKERAASIYAQLTQWGVDPALIELDGKNTFRARIFPVEANQDVRVEMHLIEPLQSSVDGQSWKLPLLQRFLSPRRLSRYLPVAKTEAPRYDRLEIEVESREPGLVNFPGARYLNGKWRLSAKNIAADRDFALRWARPKPQPLRADLFSSRASGQTGYFSLLLTASQALQKPRLLVSGVSVSDVFPAKMPDLKAGENVLICGRYRGAGAAEITLKGTSAGAARTLSTSAIFSTRMGANNPAAKLWAARQIAALGADEARRARVIALSKRWGLPSAQTSWLAVPASEKTNFERTKRGAETRKIARQIASDLVLGDVESANRNRVELEKFYKPSYGSRQSFLTTQTEMALYYLTLELARAHASEAMEIRPDSKQLSALRAQLVKAIAAKQRLTREADEVKLEGYLMSAQNEVAQRRTQQIAPQYAEAVLEEGATSKRARELKIQLERLKKFRLPEYGSFDVVQDEFYQRLRVPLHQLAYEKQREAARLKPDFDKIAGINADMDRLLAFAGSKAKNQFLGWQSMPAERDATFETLQQYADEAQKAAPDEARLRALHGKTGELVAKQLQAYKGWSVQPGDPTYEQYIRPYAQNPLDAPEIKAAQKSGDKRELVAQIDRKRRFFARPGDPLIEVGAPADCTHVIAILPSGEIKRLLFNPLSQKWEVRFDVPGYATDATYRIQILIAEKMGARRRLTLTYSVDTAAPTATTRATNRDGAATLQVETDTQTDRVTAFTPWNERVELRRDEAGMFSARVAVPTELREQKAKVRFVLTDKAHNRTEISVDLE